MRTKRAALIGPGKGPAITLRSEEVSSLDVRGLPEGDSLLVFLELEEKQKMEIHVASNGLVELRRDAKELRVTYEGRCRDFVACVLAERKAAHAL